MAILWPRLGDSLSASAYTPLARHGRVFAVTVIAGSIGSAWDLLQLVLLDIQIIKIQADDLGPSLEQIISKLLGQGTQPLGAPAQPTQ
jgi:hypothetical protein